MNCCALPVPAISTGPAPTPKPRPLPPQPALGEMHSWHLYVVRLTDEATINRDQLIDMAYGENIYVDDRTIDSHIKRIRKKFRVIDNEFSQIETLYGVGYKYKEE